MSITLKHKVRISSLCIILLTFGAVANADSVVMFNEIMYHPQTGDNLEWIELYNQMGTDIDMSGWSLQGGIEYFFPEGTIIGAGDYIVVASAPELLLNLAPVGVLVYGPFTGQLSNNGERLYLFNNSGRLLNEMRYRDSGEWPVAPDGSGVSLAKLNQDKESDNPANWTWSEQVGGSPGSKNFVLNKQPIRLVRFNEMASVNDDTFYLELINISKNSLNLNGLHIEIQGSIEETYECPDSILDAGKAFWLSSADIGFIPAQGDRLFLWYEEGKLLDAVVADDTLRGRYPDGTGQWLYPSVATLGQTNIFDICQDIVINEIMYHPMELPEREESPNWIELYNRGIETIDLSGWSFTDGIDFTFPQGTTMEPGEYLVVSENVSSLSSKFPDVDIIGDFDGNLSNRGESLVLSDQYGNPVNTIRYYDGGSWPEYADGGGCSMELIDPWANNNRAEAWAASNEFEHTVWQEYAYRMVAERSTVGNDSLYSEFVMGLLDQGEILIDDIEVIEDPDGAAMQLLQNSDFSKGTDKWRILGNHSTSIVVPDPENASNSVLKLIATGPTEHMSNHAETTLANSYWIRNGLTYEIRYRARWIAGTPLLNTRLFFNRVAYTTCLDVPECGGTPGAINSQAKPNIGPTFASLKHSPAVPLQDQTVNVTVQAEDFDGILSMILWYRQDNNLWQSETMTLGADSLYSASIPGYETGSTVQFYIEGRDNLFTSSFYPAAGPESFAQYEVLGQMPRDTGVHNYRIIMRETQKDKLYEVTNLMSNEYLGATLIVNESDIYYNVGVRLKSSEHGRPPDKQAGRIGFSLRFEKQNPFRGVYDKLAFDRSGGQVVGQQEMLLHAAMNRFGGPSKYHDLGYLMAPDPEHSSGAEVQMARFERLFCEESYGNEGGSGTLYEYELIYYQTQTVGGDPEGLKYPQERPIVVQGRSVNSYLGQDKESYRWHFLIKNNRDVDNYEPIMNMTYVLSMGGSEFFSAIEQAFDVDEWMRSFAVGSSYGPGDNWIGNASHNALFYHRPSDDKILFFLHDLDHTNIGVSIKRNSILQKITANPHWDHIFLGYIYDFLQTSFNREYMSYWTDHYTQLLPEQNWSSWLNYIENRHNNVQQQLQQVLPPEIPFEISTVSATIDRESVGRVEGQGWINVNWILVVETGTILDVTWDDLTHWYGNIYTEHVPGTYTLEAYDSQNKLLGTDTVQLVLSN